MEVACAEMLTLIPAQKAILVFPYIAIASEKLRRFTPLFPAYRVCPFYHGMGREMLDADIGVTTFERANILLCAAAEGKYLADIGLIVIHEVHMLSGNSRGCVVEALILKAILLGPAVRIILLSATLRSQDVMRLSEWIGGIACVSASRSAALIQHIVSLIPNGSSLVQIQRHSIENGKTVLTDCKRFKTSDTALQFIAWNAYKGGDAKILVFVSARKKRSRRL
jgi:replicative superfamily II helicase